MIIHDAVLTLTWEQSDTRPDTGLTVRSGRTRCGHFPLSIGGFCLTESWLAQALVDVLHGSGANRWRPLRGLAANRTGTMTSMADLHD